MCLFVIRILFYSTGNSPLAGIRTPREKSRPLNWRAWVCTWLISVVVDNRHVCTSTIAHEVSANVHVRCRQQRHFISALGTALFSRQGVQRKRLKRCRSQSQTQRIFLCLMSARHRKIRGAPRHLCMEESFEEGDRPATTNCVHCRGEKVLRCVACDAVARQAF